MAPLFERAIAADSHPDLILMWSALAQGWQPPEEVSREEYYAAKAEPPSAKRGFIGFGASFAGKWWGGFIDRPVDRHIKKPGGYRMPPFCSTMRRAVLKDCSAFVNREIVCSDFAALIIPDGAVVYCDPPYAQTVGYNGTGKFDHSRFWKWAEDLTVRGCAVFVSEQTAPSHWRVLASRDRKMMLKVVAEKENEMRQEKIFWLGPYA
jgi:DNA adenine methylase